MFLIYRYISTIIPQCGIQCQPHCGIIVDIIYLKGVGNSMHSKEFSRARRYLGKTQNQLAQLLAVSPKAIQSFEQGWRRIPPYVERQMLVLLSLKSSSDRDTQSCWDLKNCPQEWRENCIIWELKAGDFCWSMNGTF